MEDIKLFVMTLNRLELTYQAASLVCGKSRSAIRQYAEGRNRIPPEIWKSLLEYEITIHERKKEIERMASAFSGTIPEKPKRRGRPRRYSIPGTDKEKQEE